METFEELVDALKKVKAKGYIKTHRKGNTGIGKTLEDELGIEENNVPGPDVGTIERKSGRRNSSSRLTLVTKSPMPEAANSAILKNFGYPSSKGTKHIHTTVNALAYNKLKGNVGFKVEVQDEKILLVDANGQQICYWDEGTLKNSFEKKMVQLAYVKADNRGRGNSEEFWFNEAWLLSDFNFENFIKLLKDGTIVIDVRIGQYANGSPHDHGTGFRINENSLDSLFNKRERIL